MSTRSAEYEGRPDGAGQVSVEELARRQGVRPVQSADDLARDDVWESDEELDAFLADLYVMRHADLSM